MAGPKARGLLCDGGGGRLNRVAVATGKRGGGGDAARALLRFVKVLVAAMLSRPLGAAQSALLRGASLWAAECGMHVIWPCGGVRPREMRAEGRRRRRRPWKPSINQYKCMLLLCRFRSCDSSAAIPECSPTPGLTQRTHSHFGCGSRGNHLGDRVGSPGFTQ